jgi:hypothetical protein
MPPSCLVVARPWLLPLLVSEDILLRTGYSCIASQLPVTLFSGQDCCPCPFSAGSLRALPSSLLPCRELPCKTRVSHLAPCPVRFFVFRSCLPYFQRSSPPPIVPLLLGRFISSLERNGYLPLTHYISVCSSSHRRYTKFVLGLTCQGFSSSSFPFRSLGSS